MNNPDVATVLVQHWANMVCEKEEQLEGYRTALPQVEQRAARLYTDNIALHSMLDGAFAETTAYEMLATRMSQLVNRIVNENPGMELELYRNEYIEAVNQFNMATPFDLTADEEVERLDV